VAFGSSSAERRGGVGSFGKNPTSLARRKLVEVKNGRLAMIGFGGMLHQQLLFKQATIEQLLNFKAIN
jgi:hypothetical protein